MGIHGKRDIEAGHDVAGRDVRTEQRVTIDADSASNDPRNSRDGVAVRLEGLENQFSRFAEIQATEWNNVRVELRATREQIEDLMQADAIRRARLEVETERDRHDFQALKKQVAQIDETLNGNGKLGTAKWEKITRGIAVLAFLVAIFVLIVVVLQNVSMMQMQQQIAILLEAVP